MSHYQPQQVTRAPDYYNDSLLVEATSHHLERWLIRPHSLPLGEIVVSHPGLLTAVTHPIRASTWNIPPRSNNDPQPINLLCVLFVCVIFNLFEQAVLCNYTILTRKLTSLSRPYSGIKLNLFAHRNQTNCLQELLPHWTGITLDAIKCSTKLFSDQPHWTGITLNAIDCSSKLFSDQAVDNLM